MSEREELVAVIKGEIGDLKAKFSEAQRSMKGVEGAAKDTSTASTGMNTSIRSLGTSLLGIAGLTMGAAGAFKFVRESIMSTQATGDAFTATMQGMRESVTALMQALASGEIDNFGTRLRGAYQAGVDYANALDEISDRMRAVRVRTAEYTAEMRELYTQLYERETRTLEEREAALQKYAELNDQLLAATQENNKLLIEAERQRLMGTKNVTEEQANLLIEYVRHYDELTQNELQNVRKAEEAQRMLTDAHKAATSVRMHGQSIMGALHTKTTTQEKTANEEVAQSYRDLVAGLNEKERAYFELGSAINRFADDERENVAQALIGLADAETKYQALNQRITRHANTMARERRDGLKEEQEEWKRTLEILEDVNRSLAESLNELLRSRDMAMTVPMRLEFEFEEADIFDAIEQEAIAHGQWMQDWAASLQRSIHSLLVEGLIDSLDMLGTALGAALSGNDFDIGDNMLMMMADWAKKLGSIMVAAGTAVFAFQSQLAFNPLAVAGFGAALIVAGAAVKGAISERPGTGISSSYGGGAGGEGGDLFGIRSLGEFALSVTGEIIADGSQLKTIIRNEDEREGF
jgi:hypothetical protein